MKPPPIRKKEGHKTLTTQEKYLEAWDKWCRMLGSLEAVKVELTTFFLDQFHDAACKPTPTSPIVMMFIAFCAGYDMGREADNEIVPMLKSSLTMTDYEWQRGALESRQRDPQPYIDRGEDVEATIKMLKAWLAEHAMEVRS